MFVKLCNENKISKKSLVSFDKFLRKSSKTHRIKTKDFIRVRVGVAPSTPSGKLRKPKGEDAVIKFLMSNFGKKEMEDYRAIEKQVEEALSLIVSEGYQVAMNKCN